MLHHAAQQRVPVLSLKFETLPLCLALYDLVQGNFYMATFIYEIATSLA